MPGWFRSGRPSNSLTEVNIAIKREIVIENPHSSLKKVAADLSVYKKSIRNIFNNHLGMELVATCLASKNLIFL